VQSTDATTEALMSRICGDAMFTLTFEKLNKRLFYKIKIGKRCFMCRGGCRHGGAPVQDGPQKPLVLIGPTSLADLKKGKNVPGDAGWWARTLHCAPPPRSPTPQQGLNSDQQWNGLDVMVAPVALFCCGRLASLEWLWPQ
jgi:hypothetical protein